MANKTIIHLTCPLIICQLNIITKLLPDIKMIQIDRTSLICLRTLEKTEIFNLKWYCKQLLMVLVRSITYI